MLFLALLSAAALPGGYLALLGFGKNWPPLYLSGNRIVAGAGIVMLAAAAAAALAHYSSPTAVPPLAVIQEAALTAQAKIIAAGIRAQTKLPSPIDDLLRLEDISAEQDKIIYHLSIAASGSDEFHAVFNDIQENLRKTACAREDYRTMLRSGFTVEMRFFMPNGPKAQPLTFTPKLCGFP